MALNLFSIQDVNQTIPSPIGTVTSVAFADGSSVPIYTVSGSPVTTTGTLTISLSTEAKNLFLAGPTTGSNAQPTFRSILGVDLPQPGASTYGAVLAYGSTTNQFVTGISTNGALASAQAAFSQLSGAPLGVSLGGTGASTFTLGSVLFAGTSGVFNQDNTSLFYDSTNHKLGVGVTGSGASFTLDVGGAIRVGVAATGSGLFGTDGSNTNLLFSVTRQASNHLSITSLAGIGFCAVRVVPSTQYDIFIDSSHNVGIATTGQLSKLDVNGNCAIGSYAATNAAPTQGLIVSGSVGLGTNSPSYALDVGGEIATHTAGQGFRVKEGTNARMGTAILASGAVVVATTVVTASSRIFLTNNAQGGVVGALSISGRTAGSSFAIASTNVADTSTIAWIVFEPA